MKYEEALKQLEEIVAKMENDELDIVFISDDMGMLLMSNG